MTSDKKTAKPEKPTKVKGYRGAKKQIHDDGLCAGRFDLGTDTQTVSDALIANRMETERRGIAARFQISNYKSGYPPALDPVPNPSKRRDRQTLGFSILPPHPCSALKKLPFDLEKLCQDLRKELAP